MRYDPHSRLTGGGNPWEPAAVGLDGDGRDNVVIAAGSAPQAMFYFKVLIGEEYLMTNDQELISSIGGEMAISSGRNSLHHVNVHPTIGHVLGCYRWKDCLYVHRDDVVYSSSLGIGLIH